MGEQVGLIYNVAAANVATPNTDEGLRIYKNPTDSQYYVKKSDGTSELFIVGLNSRSAKTLFFEQLPVGNVGAGNQNLYADSIPLNTLQRNGDAIKLKYAITTTASADDKIFQVVVGANTIYDSSAAGLNLSAENYQLSVEVLIMRISANTLRFMTSVTSNSITTTFFGDVVIDANGGYDFTAAIDVLLKGNVPGIGANDDIQAIFAHAEFIPFID